MDTLGAKNVLKDARLGESAEKINGVFVHLAGTMAKCPLTEGLLYVVKKKHLKHSFD